MEHTVLVRFTFVWLLSFFAPPIATSQVNHGGANISTSFSKLSPAVREEVERLLSDDRSKRATAAASLGEMGVLASPAIPWLFAAASDDRSVLSLAGGSITVQGVAAACLWGRFR